MVLTHLSLTNYKNLEQLDLEFSPQVNCFVGKNGMGKTNILDAIYYMSFLKSNNIAQDAQIVRHGDNYFILQGKYSDDRESRMSVNCSYSLDNRRKSIRVDDKRVSKFSDFVGSIPLVMISPSDSMLIHGGSEERRKFMDALISQYDKSYTQDIIQYDRLLKQRNSLLKQEEEPDWSVMDVIEGMMSELGGRIYEARQKFVSEFIPVFKSLYSELSDVEEQVDIVYVSHCHEGVLLEQLKRLRPKERILGFSMHGTHKDDLLFLFNDYAVKKEGSQGQSKTYFIALKLAQFIYLKEKMAEQGKKTGEERIPLLLLDDIFDKLDMGRVRKIISYLTKSIFSQVFITDTEQEHLDAILSQAEGEYALFHVEQGQVERMK